MIPSWFCAQKISSGALYAVNMAVSDHYVPIRVPRTCTVDGGPCRYPGHILVD